MIQGLLANRETGGSLVEPEPEPEESQAKPPPRSLPGLHVLAKPAGALCNLACKYCFYLEKKDLYDGKQSPRMSEEVLECFIQQYIAASPAPEVSFAWQGGEPTLMGLDFFRRVVELQRKYRPSGTRITNAFQTNGLLLDEVWCEFLRREEFLVGLSIDGPGSLHDGYRVDRRGRPTLDRVLRVLERLQHHKVEFNTLTVVHRENGQRPFEVYRFLKKHGCRFLQFIPLVERAAADGSLAGPPELEGSTSDSPVTPWSVRPEDYGNFLCAVFDEWIRHDVGEIHVQLFEVQLAIRMGLPASLCLFAPTCGRGMVVEHNGDVYACDHYVYPEYGRGNILSRTLAECAASPEQREFGRMKRDGLPHACRECETRFACHGECPKRRFMTTPDGAPGLNYLCPAYKQFFRHIEPDMRTMADLLNRGLPAALIMDLHARKDGAAPHGTQRAGRNDPCPCGSGKKYKKCCGARQP
jgi:uncharacterized protein